MNKHLLLIAGVAALMFLGACGKSEKTIETNPRGVPVNIADIIIGDLYAIDTLYQAEDYVVVHINNSPYTQQIIYINDEVVANSPTLEIDSINQSVYMVNDVMRSAKVNFASQQSIDRLRSIYPTFADYSTVVVGDTSTVGQKAIFSFAASVPDQKVKHADEIKRWIEHCLVDTFAYESSVRDFGQKMEKKFFGDWPKSESEFQYSNSRSMLIYDMTPNYITYYDYFWGFLGGAHGMYCQRFVSYSLTDNCPITAEYLFKIEDEDYIRELIYEALADDEDFMSNNKITSVSQVRSYVQRFTDGDALPIPAPGLLPQGVVFCYQPYDIAPYAAGAFQLVVPYDKIAKYFVHNPLQ